MNHPTQGFQLPRQWQSPLLSGAANAMRSFEKTLEAGAGRLAREKQFRGATLAHDPLNAIDGVLTQAGLEPDGQTLTTYIPNRSTQARNGRVPQAVIHGGDRRKGDDMPGWHADSTAFHEVSPGFLR